MITEEYKPSDFEYSDATDMVECMYQPTDEYGGIIQFHNYETPTDSVYSDRMFSANYEKFNECSREVFGNEGQLFYDDREPKDVERFLQLYYGKPNLQLCYITRYTNQSTGYPYWHFRFRYI